MNRRYGFLPHMLYPCISWSIHKITILYIIIIFEAPYFLVGNTMSLITIHIPKCVIHVQHLLQHTSRVCIVSPRDMVLTCLKSCTSLGTALQYASSLCMGWGTGAMATKTHPHDYTHHTQEHPLLPCTCMSYYTVVSPLQRQKVVFREGWSF